MGREKAPSPTPPEDEFMPLGKVRRGSFNPFDLKEEMSHFVRHDDKWRRQTDPPPAPPKNDFMNLEKSWEFSTSFQMTV